MTHDPLCPDKFAVRKDALIRESEEFPPAFPHGYLEFVVTYADHLAAYEDVKKRAYLHGLDRAREAVAAFLVGDTDCDWTYSRCLAAIDALKEK